MSMFALRVGYQIIILRRRSGLNLDIDSHDVGSGLPMMKCYKRMSLNILRRECFFTFSYHPSGLRDFGVHQIGSSTLSILYVLFIHYIFISGPELVSPSTSLTP